MVFLLSWRGLERIGIFPHPPVEVYTNYTPWVNLCIHDDAEGASAAFRDAPKEALRFGVVWVVQPQLGVCGGVFSPGKPGLSYGNERVTIGT